MGIASSREAQRDPARWEYRISGLRDQVRLMAGRAGRGRTTQLGAGKPMVFLVHSGSSDPSGPDRLRGWAGARGRPGVSVADVPRGRWGIERVLAAVRNRQL